jgi:DNA-3-methyladenine glycosylase II
VGRIPGLSEVTPERLRALADAALAGDLDAARLRAMPPADALAHLRTLPGIGPFSAELILIRGAATPTCSPPASADCTPPQPAPTTSTTPIPRQLAELSARWAPYRSWAARLPRTHREETTHEIAQGRTAHPA